MPDATTGPSENELPALGICFEEYAYPHPVKFVPVQSDLQTLAMGYMDVPPESEPNGKTVVLMHGKAFGGYYFEHVIEALTATGYRVVVPDQIGWGKSSKPISTTASSSWPPTPRLCSITSASGRSPSSATRPAA